MTSPARRQALLGAAVVGGLATLLALARALHEPGWSTDFDQFHAAANALLRGESPYGAVGPDGSFQWDWPLFYPLPAVLFVVPFAWLPVAAGRVAFAAVSGAVLGYAIGRDGAWRLPMCLSAAFLVAIARSQWSPLVTAAFFLPWAGIFLAAKPNVAAAVLAGVRTWRHLAWLAGVGAVLVAASLVVNPAWPVEWIRALMTKQFVSAPVTNPAGFLILLALLRWRRAEARILVVLACVPQTPSVYDLLPLFVVAATLRQVTVLSLLTTALLLVIVFLGPFPTFNDYAHMLERWAVFVVYLPAVLMVLQRPNTWTGVEPAPATGHPGWRERVAALPRLDAWLLTMLGTSAALLVWATLTTERL